MSHPTRDVWVEISHTFRNFRNHSVTSHTGCVSRNTKDQKSAYEGLVSHPTRDVWVEINMKTSRKPRSNVTSHTGCVSRNFLLYVFLFNTYVTSHMGCVSRNRLVNQAFASHCVISHMECVSRNDLSNFNTSKVIELYSLKDVWVERIVW